MTNRSVLSASLITALALSACGKGANNQATTALTPTQTPIQNQLATPPRPAYDCAKAKPATAPSGSPADDVLGVRPGMPAGIAEAVLACQNSSYALTRNEGLRFDLPSINQGAQPDTSIDAEAENDKVEVVLLGMPGQELAERLSHYTIYPNDKPQPPFAAQRQSLITKYGSPTSEEKSGQYHDYLHWIYEPSSRPMSDKNPSYSQCSSGGGVDSSFSFNRACGLTIWADIETTDSGGVFRVDVSIMNQAAAMDAVDKEKAAIALRNTPTGTAGKL